MLLKEIADILIKRAVKSIHINRMIYKITARHKFINITDEEVSKARSCLENVSPNPKTSCITENEINPVVDVQFIVPVYNMEKYIRQCLDSVINAEKKYSYRLTVINDGSTDGTAEILKQYEDHPNVEIITQKNKGFSGARNSGLKHISGNYISFLDSDDFIEWSGIEKMLDIAYENNYDLVEGAYVVISESGERIKHIINGIKGKVSPTAGKLQGYPCGKIIKSDYFADICFPEKYWFEDSVIFATVFSRIKTAFITDDTVYYYRSRRNSITHKSRSYDKSVDSYWVVEQLAADRRKLGIKITQDYYEYILHMVQLTYNRTRFRSKECRRSIFILQADFINKRFSEFSTINNFLTPLEKALRTGDYGYYEAFCQWLGF